MRIMQATVEVVVGVVLMLGWILMRLVEGRPDSTKSSVPNGSAEQLRLPGIADPHQW